MSDNSLSEYKKALKKDLKPRTVIFLIKGNKVLLGFKKIGFGKNYYIGIGGKVEDGETIESAAIREINEEIHVSITPNNLIKTAILRFYFPHIADESWNQEVHAYLVKNWEENPSSSNEIEPTWFDNDELPVNKMWDDAQYWIPKILKGEKVYEEYLFNDDLAVIDHQSFSIKR